MKNLTAFFQSLSMLTLLGRLRKARALYPPELQAARRSQYLSRAADLNIGAHGLSAKAAASLHSAVTSTLEVALQTVLGIMVAGLVVTAAVVYRDQIVDFITPDNGGVVPSAMVIPPATLTPLPEASPTVSTPLVKPLRATATATPTPTTEPTNTKVHPGLHLGQTPTRPSDQKNPKP